MLNWNVELGHSIMNPFTFRFLVSSLLWCWMCSEWKAKQVNKQKARKVVRTSAEDFKVFYLLLSGKKRVIFLYPCENLIVNSFWQKEWENSIHLWLHNGGSRLILLLRGTGRFLGMFRGYKQALNCLSHRDLLMKIKATIYSMSTRCQAF